MGGDYEVLGLEGGCKGREGVLRGPVVDIMDVGWRLIGAGEKSNGMMGWRGVVLGVWLGGGASVGEGAEDSR